MKKTHMATRSEGFAVVKGLKMEKNKGIYQPEVHEKGWSERKIDKIRDLILFDCKILLWVGKSS